MREVLGASRETSIVWTKLEEACMFATKGVCMDGFYAEEQPQKPPLAGVVVESLISESR